MIAMDIELRVGLALRLVFAAHRVRRSGEWAEPLLLWKVGGVGVELDCVCTCQEWTGIKLRVRRGMRRGGARSSGTVLPTASEVNDDGGACGSCAAFGRAAGQGAGSNHSLMREGSVWACCEWVWRHSAPVGSQASVTHRLPLGIAGKGVTESRLVLRASL